MNTTAQPIASAPAPSVADVSSRAAAQPWARQLMAMSAVSVVVTTVGLSAYDRFVAQPSRRLGVVDIAAIYRAKEEEYTRAFYKAAASPAPGPGTPGAASGPAQLVQDFAQRLPVALNDLRRECRCVIVVRGAVATLGEGMVDLTPALRSKLGMQP